MTVTDDSVAPSELENVIAVFGAVDRAVQDDDPTGERRARVAALLPLYESPQVHWYRVMLQMAIDRGANLPEAIGDSEESVAEALRGLTEAVPGSNHLAARRLLGLYAAAQAVPEMFAPGGSHGPLVAGALSAVLRRRFESEELSGRADAAAESLHEFLAAEHPSSDEQSSEERWDEMIEEVRLYVDVSGLERPSCTDKLVERPGYPGPATALRSEFDVTDVPFNKAVKILAPENWPRCMNIWCHMDARDAPPHRYDEEVSTNCHSPENAFFTKHAILDFDFDHNAEEFAITTYNLAPAPVQQPPDGLLVDRGSLVVHQLPDRLHITTTKRLRFKGALSGAGLSLFACLFGWTGKGKGCFPTVPASPMTGSAACSASRMTARVGLHLGAQPPARRGAPRAKERLRRVSHSRPPRRSRIASTIRPPTCRTGRTESPTRITAMARWRTTWRGPPSEWSETAPGSWIWR